MSTFAAAWRTDDVFWSILWFFLFFIWIWLLIGVIADLFRSHDLSGWAKALWVIGIIIFPFLGVLVYLIARGSKMSKHAVEDAQARDEAFRSYVQQAAGSNGGGASTADELEKLARLRDQGVLSETEYQQAKAKALA